MIDVVALSDSEVSVQLPADLLTHKIEHTVGDDLFLLGFPAGVTDYTLQPIWKRATIATEPRLGWNKQKQFLVDSASRKGMSGGAALYFSKMGQLPVSLGSSVMILQPLHILHGIYVGRIGDSEFEAQVGVVWKKEIIDEIIDSGVPGTSTWQKSCRRSRQMDPGSRRRTNPKPPADAATFPATACWQPVPARRRYPA